MSTGSYSAAAASNVCSPEIGIGQSLRGDVMKTMLFLIVAAATASAQVVTGTIGGKVSDSSGATIPNPRLCSEQEHGV